MTFTDSIKTCFSKYATFSGRASRPEYWWFVVFFIVADLLLATLDSVLFGTVVTTSNSFEASTNTPILSGLFGLAMFLPTISVTVRRLHDGGRSGWWYWIALIPLVGFIVLIVWLASAGERVANRYGPQPGRGNSGT